MCSKMGKSNRRAVVLGYEHEQNAAPVVQSRATGQAADEILRAARRWGVSIHQEKNLIDKLEKVPTDSEISPDLYDRVAEILVASTKNCK